MLERQRKPAPIPELDPAPIDPLKEEYLQTLFDLTRAISCEALKFGFKKEDGEDLIQTIALKILTSDVTPKDSAQKNTKGFIKTIARNLLIDRVRRTQKEMVGLYDKQLEDLTSPNGLSGDFEESLVNGIFNNQILAKVWADLPQGYREILWLRDIMGYRYNQITEITGTNMSAVKSRIFRARKAARALYISYLSEKTLDSSEATITQRGEDEKESRSFSSNGHNFEIETTKVHINGSDRKPVNGNGLKTGVIFSHATFNRDLTRSNGNGNQQEDGDKGIEVKMRKAHKGKS